MRIRKSEEEGEEEDVKVSLDDLHENATVQEAMLYAIC